MRRRVPTVLLLLRRVAPAALMRSLAPTALPLLACVLLAGCVFRNAGEPRFYRPASAALDGASGGDASDGSDAAAGGVASAAEDASAASARRNAAAVRLEPVVGTPFLRERIAWRASDVEFGLYEQRRWSELPASYVERALASALRTTPGLRLTDAYDAPALRVTVVAFDDVLAPSHLARVSLTVSLRARDRSRLLDRTFSAEVPVAGDTGSATASAMGRALDQVVADVAAAVAGVLDAR